MLFMIAGFLKEGVEDQLINYHDDFNEHLGPSGSNVRISGVLRNPDGGHAGYLALFDGSNIEEAKAWLHEGPLFQADLYERVDVFEYQIQVGHIS